MCGIWTYIQLKRKQYNDDTLFKNFMNIKHRGPNMSSFQQFNNIYIGFHRLAIMEPSFTSNQPYIIKNNDKTIVFICNGEIYNFAELITEYNLPIYDKSDCMTLPYLYIKFVKDNNIEDFVNLFQHKIKGEFAFILYEFKDQELVQMIIGRDQIGIRPLYKSTDIAFSSEIKGLNFINEPVYEFDPATIMQITFEDMSYNKTVHKFNKLYATKELSIIKNDNEIILSDMLSCEYNINSLLTELRQVVIKSVERRLVADRPIAFLLSGGVDSSLVAGIASKKLGKINTFCCGMNEGTDLYYARKVAQYIGSNHTEVLFTAEEGINAIRDVIWTTETWDTTTIRASVGQYLVSKHIGTETNAKVVMVGEGPDEVCSSYLFNYFAPSGEELHDCALEYVNKIHIFDGRRADRCISRWGLEGRIALLDPEFIEMYWKIPASWRHPKFKGVEKWWLRQAFAEQNTIPDEVLWRKKEAFSDGISGKEKSWFEILQDFIKTQVTEEEMLNSSINAPTLEAYYYKKIFIELFGKEKLDIIPNYWQPKWINKDKYVDPSARVLAIY